jgi:hypothetical protein
MARNTQSSNGTSETSTARYYHPREDCFIRSFSEWQAKFASMRRAGMTLSATEEDLWHDFQALERQSRGEPPAPPYCGDPDERDPG